MIVNNKLPQDFTIDRYGLHVRFVNESDAEFIVRLRTDGKLGRYIHATTPDIGAQIEWTSRYKQREAAGEDYYFMFESLDGKRLGLCRIYDIHPADFTVGSWLFSPAAPMGAAILADIITREIGFGLCPEGRLLFDVRAENTNVIRYQRTYKPVVLKETESDVFFELSRDNFEKYKMLHLRMFAPKQ